jgi:hypothetical protein
MTKAVDQDDRRWWHPVRSALALAMLLLGLGVATAALLGVAALGLAELFDRALG